MKEKLISLKDIRTLHPVFRGRYGEVLIDVGVKLSGLQNANDIYDQSKHLTGISFCRDLLNNLKINRIIRNAEVLEKYKNLPFITVSNHPYGHIDGITLMEAVGYYSDRFKLLVNHILGLIDTLEDNFIVVNPHQLQASITLNGVKQCLKHLKKGNSLGFFPSGAVSYISFRNRRFEILDRDWQLSVIKLIRKAGVPVIPIHISGRNSMPFYLSRIFGWKARNLLLCHELKNKEGREITITVGNPILPEFMQIIRDDTKLGKYLKQRTYSLAQ
ncbi:1-acyl-sn-glycerol-3-phosphate acyltransferase [Proteiniphilum sp.]|uniref:1-acyl-sn-glycerol-3-phosphate acyltransferase n=1 Tax=Proteiniphilum sp. TaxID=1926877 RepID=UPI002B214A0C|nr:1-acyl-sn-glycerol-3-phosphate acyltransferase [Proteiniphilum sp.]MEA4917974.1 1-acyl-sn-glycerol-3-phosphate acyltransferase [Proteiniphilum sp.]